MSDVTLIKRGARGSMVLEIQKALDKAGYWTYHKFTDFFGGITETAVKKFQKANGLVDDGWVGPKTLDKLGIDIDISTDLTETGGVGDYAFKTDTDNKLAMLDPFTTHNGLEIQRAYLDTDEFVRDYGIVKPVNLVWHHTAGWHNPINTISSWNRDKRGRVATQWCIGGPSIKGDTKWDGVVVECFPDGYLGWHMGKVGSFEKMSKLAVGIEINNFGYLYERDGKFYAYPARSKGQWRSDYHKYEVPADQVCDLGYEFRGYRYWHKYSPKQIDALIKLTEHIMKIYPGIDASQGIPELLKTQSPAEAFGFQNDAYYGKVCGLWSHTSARKDKFDVSPQPLVVDAAKKFAK